jgi:hypothetical protein
MFSAFLVLCARFRLLGMILINRCRKDRGLEGWGLIASCGRVCRLANSLLKSARNGPVGLHLCNGCKKNSPLLETRAEPGPKAAALFLAHWCEPSTFVCGSCPLVLG